MNRPVPSAVRGRSHRPRTPVRAGRFRDDAPPLPRLHDAGRALVATALALLAIAFGTAGPGALAAAGPAEGSGFADLEAKVRSFTLPNHPASPGSLPKCRQYRNSPARDPGPPLRCL